MVFDLLFRNKAVNPNDVAIPLIVKYVACPYCNVVFTVMALAGIVKDLADIYTGEKSIGEVDAERDALQVYHTIKGLEDKGGEIDPQDAAEELRKTVNTHIQDEKLREAYNTVIDHYLQTHHRLRGESGARYLQALLEEERSLGRKLAGKGLTETQIARLRNLYRMLNLLTARSTLGGLKRFHSEIAREARVKAGGREFVPVHGPLVTALADDYSDYRRASGEKRKLLARAIAATYEPLLMTGPYIEKKVAKILDETRWTEKIPVRKHKEFMRALERMQVRRPRVEKPKVEI